MLERGAIYLAKLYPSKGHEVGKTRPVLVLQNNVLTQDGHTTVIILPLTTQLIDNTYPLRFRVKNREMLIKESDLLCDQIRAIDIHRIEPRKIATLERDELEEIQEQVKAILAFY